MIQNTMVKFINDIELTQAVANDWLCYTNGKKNNGERF